MDRLKRELDSEIAELDKIKTGREMARVITRIIDIVMKEADQVSSDLAAWERAPLSLDRMAALAELEIKQKQLNKIRKGILKAIKESTSRLILAASKPGRN